MSERTFRDRDQIQTKEDFFFTVVGNLHPKDRVIAYLKYIPNKSGKWGNLKKRYERVLKYYSMNNLFETINFLRKNYPQYLFYSKEYSVSFSSVPKHCIVKHYRPEEGLDNIIKNENLDSLQKKTLNLIHLINTHSGINLKNFGVTGSLLTNIHRQFSDIDLIIYGKLNSQIVKKTIQSSINNKIRRLDGKHLEDWIESKTRLYPLTIKEAKTIFRRKWNRGMYDNTLFSIHPVKVESEIFESYGDRIFKPHGIVEAEAEIINSSDATFNPAIYLVDNVRITKGIKKQDVKEIVSYEGLYSDIAEKNETIICRGKIERVYDKRNGKKYHRILIGSPEAEGKDYLKPIIK
jgi:predicted nucleotidyltransferase